MLGLTAFVASHWRRLLAHALLAYATGRTLSVRYEWLNSQYVTVCMAGAFVPDLAKIALLLPATAIEQTLRLPFDWFGLHTGGGVLLSILIGVVTVGAGAVALLIWGLTRRYTSRHSPESP